MKKVLLIFIISFSLNASAQTWTLWASGLPSGIYPKLAVAPNHDIFYGLTGSSAPYGIIYKANTSSGSGSFTAMPAIPVPPSLTNNIMTIVCNVNNEPIAGIFRSNATDPFLFKFDNSTSTWNTCAVDFLPNLGAYCAAKAPNGDLWIGAKWSYIYKSTDNGLSFSRIDETPIVKSAYPCYYPTWGAGNPGDGAIYSINVDGNGRIYAGTEGAGVIYSDDAGVIWQPADFHACQAGNSSLKDSTSVMEPITNTGNLGGIGFTANNNVIFNGTQMWTFNWNSCLGLADMTAHTVTQSSGFLQYFIGTGLQVTKIVTTANGNIFLHSGSNTSVAGTIGIYTSTDGINWTLCNTGIASGNTGQAQGSLAIDGNKVFMATTDGKIWMLDASTLTNIDAITRLQSSIAVYPDPSSGKFILSSEITKGAIAIYNIFGETIFQSVILNTNSTIDISSHPSGIYFLKITSQDGSSAVKKIIKE